MSNSVASDTKNLTAKRISGLLKQVKPVVWMLLALVIIFSFKIENYFAFSNIKNIMIQSVPLLILAMGQTLIVLTQGTDLSLGAQVSLTTVLWVWLGTKGVPLWLGAIIALVCMVLVGCVNGLLVGKGRIMPFIATLGMQNILNSIALLITAGSSIYFSSKVFPVVSESALFFIPVPVWIAAGVVVVTWILLRKTRFGSNIVALGGNAEALSLAGVNTTWCLVKTYAYAGLIAGIAGLVTACRVESGQPTVGAGWEFDAVAATLLGGTSMREGKGGVIGTIFGVLLIKMLQNGLNVAGVNTLYQNAIIGSIVLLAIVFDAVARRNTDV